MKGKRIVMLSLVFMLLAALTGYVSSAPAAAASGSAAPNATHPTYISFIAKMTNESLAHPSAGTTSRATPSTSAKVVTASLSTGSAGSSSGYAPQPGDSKLKVGPVSIDFSKSKLLSSSSIQPTREYAALVGSLPDPCHYLRIVVGQADAQNVINLKVYSVYDPSVKCIPVIQPFSVTVPLGTFSTGQFTVMVNGTRLGSFTAGAVTLSSSTKN